jgi:hypothetical protein
MMLDREKVIKGLQIERECVSRDCDRNCGNCDLVQERDWLLSVYDDAITMLKEQEPKIPIHIYEKYPQHDWITDEDGKIDEWAMSYDFHNGPVCKRCYHSFCVHCEPYGFDDGPCVIDEYTCPKCECILPKGTKFCSKCGQAIKWD